MPIRDTQKEHPEHRRERLSKGADIDGSGVRAPVPGRVRLQPPNVRDEDLHSVDRGKMDSINLVSLTFFVFGPSVHRGVTCARSNEAESDRARDTAMHTRRQLIGKGC
jgi:hypothetical protein